MHVFFCLTNFSHTTHDQIICRASHHACTSSWPLEKRTGCWASPNSKRPKNTLTPSQENSGSILGFSNENSRWLSTPSPKAQHWNHSGSDTFITAHKADGWSQKGLWNLEDVWAGPGQAFHTELSYREKPHLTLHKPSQPGERHWEIKRQWSHPFWHAQSNTISAGKGKAGREWIKGQLEFRIKVEVELECADKVGEIR